MSQVTFEAEYTDTYAGEANYSWVRREQIVMTEDESKIGSKRYNALLMRRAKKAIGISGARGKVHDFGNDLEFRPYKSCTVLFINFVDSE